MNCWGFWFLNHNIKHVQYCATHMHQPATDSLRLKNSNFSLKLSGFGSLVCLRFFVFFYPCMVWSFLLFHPFFPGFSLQKKESFQLKYSELQLRFTLPELCLLFVCLGEWRRSVQSGDDHVFDVLVWASWASFSLSGSSQRYEEVK